MTTFAQHRVTVESFVDCMHGGADTGGLAGVLAENVVLIGPLSDEPLTGREAVTATIQDLSAVATDLSYKEVLSGETHHAAFFRLQIDDTPVDGMDYILLDADGKIAEVTIFWRPCRPPSRCRVTSRRSLACSPGNCAPRASSDHGQLSVYVPDLTPLS
jgi:hypothetical protein